MPEPSLEKAFRGGVKDKSLTPAISNLDKTQALTC